MQSCPGNPSLALALATLVVLGACGPRSGGDSKEPSGAPATRGVGLCVRIGASAGRPILDAEVVVPSGDKAWDEDVRLGMIGRGAPGDTPEWSPVWIADPEATSAEKPDFDCDHHPAPPDPHAHGR